MKFRIRENIPDDVKVVIETFIEQALIVEQYNLDYMPSEYMANLVETLSNHPEYSDLVLELLDMLIPDLYEYEEENEIG